MINFNYAFFPLFFFCLVQVSCQNHGKLEIVTDMPSSLDENSGIESFDGKTLWVIEDGGNNDNIFKVNFDGKIIKHFDVKNAKNKDWEDLTKDFKNNLYIGDFGNNANKREDLEIYKLTNPELEKGDKIAVEKIKFNYPEQKNYPPKKSQLYYDTEAFFHWGNSLYLITKNRTSDFKLDDFSKGSIKQIDLGIRTQLESVCFLNDSTLLLSDERSNSQGGNLYKLDLNKF